MFLVLKVEKSMYIILVCRCAESRCSVTVSKRVRLASFPVSLDLYTNWSSLSDSMSDKRSATTCTCKALWSFPLVGDAGEIKEKLRQPGETSLRTLSLRLSGPAALCGLTE